MKRKFFYFLMRLLPWFIRHALYRKFYARVPVSECEGLIFQVARTKKDLEGAFKLLHDAYVEQGFIQKRSNGMYICLQHALPTSCILVAKKDEKVIGTISLIRQNPLGLPMEKCFDISDLKKNGQRVAELSCLCVDPFYRRRLGKDIFFPLTLFSAIFAKEYFGTDYLVFNLYPKHADFYNAIFGSNYLVKNNESVQYMGAPAIGIKLNLNTVQEFAFKKYYGLTPDRDLYSFTFIKKPKNFQFPYVGAGIINFPVMTPELMKYFFCEQTHFFSELSLYEKQVFRKYYPSPLYTFFDVDNEPKNLKVRNEVRWDTKLPGKLSDDFDEQSVLILDISLSGGKLFSRKLLTTKKNYKMIVELKDKKVIEVTIEIVWTNQLREYGFKIVAKGNEFLAFIEGYSSNFYDSVS